jgi:hypothetical protein
MAWGSFSLVSCGNLTLTEVAPFVNQICDLLNLGLNCLYRSIWRNFSL